MLGIKAGQLTQRQKEPPYFYRLINDTLIVTDNFYGLLEGSEWQDHPMIPNGILPAGFDSIGPHSRRLTFG